MADALFEHLIEAPVVGGCLIVWSEHGLKRVRLGAGDLSSSSSSPSARDGMPPSSATPPPSNGKGIVLPGDMEQVVRRVERYFSGEVVDFSSVPLDDGAQSDFNRAIYAALRLISYGETTTYGDLARAAGFDIGAARAVGLGMGRNPWPVVVPCHRVMAGGGKMGGFSAPGGGATKFKLLDLEGARHPAAAPRLPGL